MFNFICLIVIGIYKFGEFLTTFVMKKRDDKQVNRGYSVKSNPTSCANCINPEQETEFVGEEGFDDLEKFCDGIFSKLRTVRTLSTLTSSREQFSNLVPSTGKGDGCRLRDDGFSWEYTSRNSPEPKAVKDSMLLEEGTVPWTPRGQASFKEEIVHQDDEKTDYLPSKMTDDQINRSSFSKPTRSGSITGFGKPNMYLEEHIQQEINKLTHHGVKQLSNGISVNENYQHFECGLGSDLDPPLTPFRKTYTGRNSWAATNHRFSKNRRSIAENIPSPEIENFKPLVIEKRMLGSGKGCKKEVVVSDELDLTRCTDFTHRESGNLQYNEGLDEYATFKDFIAADEPLLEDERLSLVGSSTTSDEDTKDRHEENIFNFYRPIPRKTVNLAINSNVPNNYVSSTGIPRRRSSTTLKLNTKHVNGVQLSDYKRPNTTDCVYGKTRISKYK